MLKCHRNKSYHFQKCMLACATQTVTGPDVAAGILQKQTISVWEVYVDVSPKQNAAAPEVYV